MTDGQFARAVELEDPRETTGIEPRSKLPRVQTEFSNTSDSFMQRHKVVTTLPDGVKTIARPARDKPIQNLRRVKPIQMWEGVVMALHDDVIEAKLFDLTDKERAPELAEVYLEYFTNSDRELLDVGSQFYWTIGIEITEFGQIKQVSEMRLRRYKALSVREEREIARKAKFLFESLSHG